MAKIPKYLSILCHVVILLSSKNLTQTKPSATGTLVMNSPDGTKTMGVIQFYANVKLSAAPSQCIVMCMQ